MSPELLLDCIIPIDWRYCAVTAIGPGSVFCVIVIERLVELAVGHFVELA